MSIKVELILSPPDDVRLCLQFRSFGRQKLASLQALRKMPYGSSHMTYRIGPSDIPCVGGYDIDPVELIHDMHLAVSDPDKLMDKILLQKCAALPPSLPGQGSPQSVVTLPSSAQQEITNDIASFLTEVNENDQGQGDAGGGDSEGDESEGDDSEA